MGEHYSLLFGVRSFNRADTRRRGPILQCLHSVLLTKYKPLEFPAHSVCYALASIISQNVQNASFLLHLWWQLTSPLGNRAKWFLPTCEFCWWSRSGVGQIMPLFLASSLHAKFCPPFMWKLLTMTTNALAKQETRVRLFAPTRRALIGCTPIRERLEDASAVQWCKAITRVP